MISVIIAELHFVFYLFSFLFLSLKWKTHTPPSFNTLFPVESWALSLSKGSVVLKKQEGKEKEKESDGKCDNLPWSVRRTLRHEKS